MKTFSFLWSPQLRAAISKAAPKRGYRMSLPGEDRESVTKALNQGIDSHLEACFVPARGDWYQIDTPPGIRGRISGPRLECCVSPESLPVLVRRLMESEADPAQALAGSICETLGIELV